jgi:signal transduction histidine kinase
MPRLGERPAKVPCTDPLRGRICSAVYALSNNARPPGPFSGYLSAMAVTTHTWPSNCEMSCELRLGPSAACRSGSGWSNRDALVGMSDTQRDQLGHRSGPSLLIDGVVAVTITVIFWVTSLVSAGETNIVLLGCALASLVLGAMVLRWRWPLVTTVVAVAATLAGWMIGVTTDPMSAAAWCLYPVALRRYPRAGSVGLRMIGVIVVFSGVLALVSAGTGELGVQPVIALGALSGAWLLGSAEARRVEAVRQSVRQAAEVERAREQSMMAREVHDVVGHALTVIRAEADVVRSLPDTDEQELRDALANIEQHAGSALEEVQMLVRALHPGQHQLGGLVGQDEPVVTSLSAVLSATRASGVDVDGRLEDWEQLQEDLSSTQRVVVIRVIQESLSNVIRHSGALACTVTVTCEDAVLMVCVDDDGSALPADLGPGTGLTGMRERVEEVGGELEVTVKRSGGVCVLARLPIKARARTEGMAG